MPTTVLWGASQVVLASIAGDARDAGSIPESGRSPGEGRGSPLQDSCLENPMDRGAWQATVHRVTESWTWLKRLSMHNSVHFLILLLTERKPRHRKLSELLKLAPWKVTDRGKICSQASEHCSVHIPCCSPAFSSVGIYWRVIMSLE